MTTTAPSRSRAGQTPPVMGIRMVRVADIDPHPKNPRRDLGDLTELTQSIQARGIRQNLTVVPTGDGRYVMVIGHRRLAAAKLAGLHDLPCDVDPDMSEAEQLEMMLLENLQRIDLTPIEEAEGYQDLLDLGVKVREICRTTGRSEKTVNARLRLLKLPDTVRAQVHTGQATLEDAARLEVLADHPKELESVTKALGTSEFNWRLQEAKKTVEYSKVRDPIIAELRRRKIKKCPGSYPDGERVAKLTSVADLDQLKLPTRVTYYLPGHEAAVHLLKPYSKSSATATGGKTAAQKAAEKQAKEDMRARVAAASDLRDKWTREFVARRKLSPAQKATILGLAVPVITTNQLSCPNPFVTQQWLTGHRGQAWDAARSAVEQLGLDPHMRLLIWYHLATRDFPTEWNPSVTTPLLAAFYDLIGQLGYLISTPERDLIGDPDAADQPADSQTAITDTEEPA